MTVPDGQQPAAGRAYSYTKQAVLAGRIPAGGWVTEGEVAQQLGLSRTPVREAFLQLQAEGLLQLHPRRGAIVVAMTPADVDAVMELRELAESFAARKVLAAGPDLLGPLLARLRQFAETQHKAGAAGDVEVFVDTDRAFHAAIVHAGGNDLLDQLYVSLRDKQQRLGSEALRRRSSRFQTILEEHEGLLESLEQGDIEGYEQRLRRHLQSSRRALAG